MPVCICGGIAAFGRLNGDFADRDAVVYGVSTDSEFVHLAWRKDKEELSKLPFPMLADVKRERGVTLDGTDATAAIRWCPDSRTWPPGCPARPPCRPMTCRRRDRATR